MAEDSFPQGTQAWNSVKYNKGYKIDKNKYMQFIAASHEKKIKKTRLCVNLSELQSLIDSAIEFYNPYKCSLQPMLTAF